jgi:hypothetical protein
MRAGPETGVEINALGFGFRQLATYRPVPDRPGFLEQLGFDQRTS